MNKIRVITPIVTQGFRDAEQFSTYAGPGTEISQVGIERGPASIECEFDECLAVPDTVAKALDAEQDGVDAVVIDCMGDPGVRPAREVVQILVLGPAETCMHVASMLGHRFSVVTVLDSVVPMLENQARVYGVADNMASARSVDIPVLELEEDRERTVKALVDESVKAVQDDGAHVVIFGCTGMMGCAAAVEEGLVARGLTGVPVIDPVPTTIQMAEGLVRAGLRHSKRTYPEPPVKRIVGFDVPNRANRA
jgi:allantoin racemase